MTIEQISESVADNEESEKNNDILVTLLVALELALENPKNLQILQEIWKRNDPAYKKWLENQVKPAP